MALSISDLKRQCKGNPARFNRLVLGRGKYWHRQGDICDSVVNYPTTLVQSGNAVGKSYADAGVLLWFLFDHPGCLVVATAPTQVQLEEVLWKQVEVAWEGARVPLGGRLLKQPLKIDLGGGWEALAYSTTKTERFSGHHRGDLLGVIDEGSGVEPEIWEAFDSLNPSRLLVTGNPLRPVGPFYERCTRARERIEAGNPDPLTNWMRISSLESPDIHLPRSRRGLADATWLAKARNDWGEGSAWWQSHVLGEFPTQAASMVFPLPWLRLAGQMAHKPAGRRRLAIDLAGGNEGDCTVLGARDDNGVIHWERSNTFSFEATARRAAQLCGQFRILPSDVSWDATAIGHDFGNRLTAAGLPGARSYVGGRKGGPKFVNLRSAAAWAARQRLDPKRLVRTPAGLTVPQQAFAIPSQWLPAIQGDLQGLSYTLMPDQKVKAMPKEEHAKQLGHSPDDGDTFIQLFAFP